MTTFQLAASGEPAHADAWVIHRSSLDGSNVETLRVGRMPPTLSGMDDALKFDTFEEATKYATELGDADLLHDYVAVGLVIRDI